MLSSKSMKNGLLRNLRGKRDGKEGGTRRKEGRGGTRDGEEGGTGRKLGWGGRRNEKSEKKMKNEKVAKGGIIGLAGPC